MISKQQYEAQLRQIFKLLLEGKTQEEIARELHIGVRSVSRYCSRIDQSMDKYRHKRQTIHFSPKSNFSGIECCIYIEA